MNMHMQTAPGKKPTNDPSVHNSPIQEDSLSASEALFGFMGWLTSRDEVTPKFSAGHDSSYAAELVKEFIEANNLSAPREKWYEDLNHPLPSPIKPPPSFLDTILRLFKG